MYKYAMLYHNNLPHRRVVTSHKTKLDLKYENYQAGRQQESKYDRRKGISKRKGEVLQTGKYSMGAHGCQHQCDLH